MSAFPHFPHFRFSKVTNYEIRRDVTEAMRFLRTCGSDGGPSQADAIQRLLSRMVKQDEALHRLKVTLDEVIGEQPRT